MWLRWLYPVLGVNSLTIFIRNRQSYLVTVLLSQKPGLVKTYYADKCFHRARGRHFCIDLKYGLNIINIVLITASPEYLLHRTEHIGGCMHSF